MTRGYFVAWLILVAAVILAVVAANRMRGGRTPLLVDARLATTPQDRQFVPCAPSPRQFPRQMERIA